MKVVMPGSYDPITLGHLAVIERAARTYSEVYVTAFVNSEKVYKFKPEERVEMIRLATEHLPNVRVGYYEGYVIDYMKENGIDAIVKGYRNETDLEYERVQAEYNFKNGGYETVLWKADGDRLDISSTLARSLIERGKPLVGVLPEKVISFINNH